MNYELLKMEITVAGYTQIEFGRKLGLSKNAINNLMNGHTKMDNVVSNKIVSILGLSSDQAVSIFFPKLSQK